MFLQKAPIKRQRTSSSNIGIIIKYCGSAAVRAE
jgi:hypothetical protein